MTLDLPLAIVAAGAAVALLHLWGRAALTLAGVRIDGIDAVVPTLA